MTDVINDEIIISSGQSVSDLNVGKDALVTIQNGGTLTTATVHDEGMVDVEAGGILTDVKLDSDGWVEVKDGGTLATVNVNQGSWLTIFSGGTATGVAENGGYVDDRNGAIVTFVANTIPSLVVSADQYATIHEATTVTTTLVTGDEYGAGWLNIYPGATVNDLTEIGRAHV